MNDPDSCTPYCSTCNRPLLWEDADPGDLYQEPLPACWYCERCEEYFAPDSPFVLDEEE